MKMKRLILLTVSVLLSAAAFAQDLTAEEFLARYERLVRNVGYAGVGVETLLDRWEEAYPDDMNVPVARFNYFSPKPSRRRWSPDPGRSASWAIPRP